MKKALKCFTLAATALLLASCGSSEPSASSQIPPEEQDPCQYLDTGSLDESSGKIITQDEFAAKFQTKYDLLTDNAQKFANMGYWAGIQNNVDDIADNATNIEIDHCIVSGNNAQWYTKIYSGELGAEVLNTKPIINQTKGILNVNAETGGGEVKLYNAQTLPDANEKTYISSKESYENAEAVNDGYLGYFFDVASRDAYDTSNYYYSLFYTIFMAASDTEEASAKLKILESEGTINYQDKTSLKVEGFELEGRLYYDEADYEEVTATLFVDEDGFVRLFTTLFKEEGVYNELDVYYYRPSNEPLDLKLDESLYTPVDPLPFMDAYYNTVTEAE